MVAFHNVSKKYLPLYVAEFEWPCHRIDEPGGGYPGTYRDVEAAVAALAANAAQ